MSVMDFISGELIIESKAGGQTFEDLFQHDTFWMKRFPRRFESPLRRLKSDDPEKALEKQSIVKY